MIRSMTAFARRDIKKDWGSAAWELRSVNQRYLETYIRLPEQLRSLEPVIRERLRNRLTRGKIECNLRFDLNARFQGELNLDENLAKSHSHEGTINPFDILRWPGVISAQEQDLDAIGTELLAELDLAIDAFIASRETEGQSLKALIEQRLDAVSAEVVKVRAQFNRESNTLASKSINTEVTNSAIELKVLIEQMREQIQNIE